MHLQRISLFWTLETQSYAKKRLLSTHNLEVEQIKMTINIHDDNEMHIELQQVIASSPNFFWDILASVGTLSATKNEFFFS